MRDGAQVFGDVRAYCVRVLSRYPGTSNIFCGVVGTGVSGREKCVYGCGMQRVEKYWRTLGRLGAGLGWMKRGRTRVDEGVRSRIHALHDDVVEEAWRCVRSILRECRHERVMEAIER